MNEKRQRLKINSDESLAEIYAVARGLSHSIFCHKKKWKLKLLYDKNFSFYLHNIYEFFSFFFNFGLLQGTNTFTNNFILDFLQSLVLIFSFFFY